MNRSRIVMIALALCTVFLVSSCSTRIADFTMWSTKNAEIGAKYVKTGRFEGKSMTQLILFIPLHIGNLKEAVDRCLENGGGEVMTNCVLFDESLPLIIYTEAGFRVEGDVWKKASMGDLMNPNTEVYEMKTASNGVQQMVSTRDVAKVETIVNVEKLAAEHGIPAASH